LTSDIIRICSRYRQGSLFLLVQFELLLCVEDESDPAVAVVRRLQDRYPTVNCRLFFGGKSGIINPMVFNMAPAYDHAANDVIWICTSRIKGEFIY
jgi:ceramide glucosyltransferase